MSFCYVFLICILPSFKNTWRLLYKMSLGFLSTH